MNNLTDEFTKTIGDRQLFRRGQSILVAVSGGLDSMVLLHLLNGLAKVYNWKLMVAHLNHKLRGKSSEADARFVKQMAKALGWPAVISAANVSELGRREKLSLEMAARKARHLFLARTAAKLGIHTVALAHHADDQLELFFLRLLRGSGSQGLLGMRWRNPSPLEKRIELVRPLLGQRRAALTTYAEQNKVPFREDATNASLDIQRNRIRHELIPLIRKKYQPALNSVIARVLDITQAEADFVTEAAVAHASQLPGSERAADILSAIAPGKLGPKAATGSQQVGFFSGANFGNLPVAVQRRSLQLQLLARGIAPDFDLVEQLRVKESRAVNVSLEKLVLAGPKRTKPVFVIRDARGGLRVKDRPVATFASDAAVLDVGSQQGEICFGGVRIQWRIRWQRGAKQPPRQPNWEWFDADRVGDKVLVRHWSPGDCFHPIGMSSAVKLQDFFTNQKVPREHRHQLVLAVSASGEVFWVEGQRISERFKLTEATNRRLQWRWQRL